MSGAGSCLLRRYARADAGALSLVEQLQAAEDTFSIAMLGRDRSAFAGLLADNALLLVCRRVLRGKAAIMRGLRPYFDGRHDCVCSEASRIEVLDGAGLAFASGALLDVPDGCPVGAFESIWRRDPDGAWRIAFAQGSDVRVAVSARP
jgi:ketosteroid isomerase-like protein